MQCPQCQQNMIQSTAGWLCINCGHRENAPAASVNSAPETPVAGSAASGATPVVPPATPIGQPTILPSSVNPTDPSAAINQTPQPTSEILAAPASSNSGLVGLPPSDQPSSAAGVTSTIGMPFDSSLAGSTSLAAPRRRSVWKIFAIIAFILVIIGGAVAGYLFFIAPKSMMATYAIRLMNAKSANYDITFTDNSGSKDTVLTSLNVSGAYDTKDTNNPKAKATIKGEYIDPTAEKTNTKGSVSAEVRYLDKTIYFKLGKSGIADLAASFLGLDIADNWYFYNLTDSIKETTESACAKKLKSSGYDKKLFKTLPFSKMAFRGAGMTDGEARLHFSGEYDAALAKSTIANFINNLPAECTDEKEAYKATADELTKSAADLQLSYDLWHGFAGDKLIIKYKTKDMASSQQITIKTSGYNKAVVVEKPADAKDLQKIIDDLTKSFESMGDTFSIELVDAAGNPVTPVNVPAASKQRNDIRAVDIDKIAMAIEIYGVSNNGRYPKSLKDLTALEKDSGQPYIESLPSDPINGGVFAYVYTSTASGDAYTLKACMEDATNNTAKSKICTGGYYIMNNEN